jgi:hypothetical protein
LKVPLNALFGAKMCRKRPHAIKQKRSNKPKLTAKTKTQMKKLADDLSLLPKVPIFGKMGSAMDGSRRKNLTRMAMNPATKQPDLVVMIHEDRLRGIVRRRNLADAYTAEHTLPETLRSPDAIFEGLRFDEDEPHNCDNQGWLCYAKRPARRYNSDGSAFDPPKRRIFLAFVNADRIVYNWTWAEADEKALALGTYLPDDYETRFEKQVYHGE